MHLTISLFALFLSTSAIARGTCESIFYQKILPSGLPIRIFEQAIDGRMEQILETPRLLVTARRGEVFLRKTGDRIAIVGSSPYYYEDAVHLPLGTDYDYQGQGYATEYKYAAIKFAFSYSNVQRIIAFVGRSNLASWNLHQKLGFEEQLEVENEGSPNLILTRDRFEKLESEIGKIEDPKSFFKPRRKIQKVGFPVLNSSIETWRDLNRVAAFISGLSRTTADTVKMQMRDPNLEKVFSDILPALSTSELGQVQYYLNRALKESTFYTMNARNFNGKRVQEYLKRLCDIQNNINTFMAFERVLIFLEESARARGDVNFNYEHHVID